MILPFDRNIMYINNIKGKYIASAINDVLRTENKISGYAMVIHSRYFGYIFFKDNTLLGAVSFLYSKQRGTAHRMPFSKFLEMDKIDFYTNTVSNGNLLKNIYDFFLSPSTLYAPYEFIDIPKTLALIKSKSYTGIASFEQGYFDNIAFFEQGEFKYFTYYNPEKKNYNFESDELVFRDFIEDLESFKPALTNVPL